MPVHAAAHWYGGAKGDLLLERHWVATNNTAFASNDAHFNFWPSGAPYEESVYSQPNRPIKDLATPEIVGEMLADTTTGLQAIADEIAQFPDAFEPQGLFSGISYLLPGSMLENPIR